jgi:DNA-binding SARP family transcriptional activator/TolB-like protein
MTPNPADRTVVHLRLIGPLQAWTTAGEEISPPGLRTRALLAVIALSAPRAVQRVWLAGLLWSQLPSTLGRAALRAEVQRLADVLAPAGTGVLEVSRVSLSLNPEVVWIDAQEIMRATDEAPGSLALMDGALLEDLDGIDPAFDQWLQQKREQLNDHARRVAEAHLLAQTEAGAIVPAARRLLSIDPVHEGGWRALMQGYAEQGEHTSAMEVYEQCCAVLAARLDTVPSAATHSVLAAIVAQDRGRSDQRRPEGSSPPDGPPTDRIPPRGGYGRQHWRRVGMLPMRCYGLEGDEAWFGPGLAGEITSALSRFFETTVVDADQIARFVRDHRDEAAVRRRFGIDFLMDGTIRRGRDRVRVSLRLLDMHAGNRIVWVDRFIRTEGDLKLIQDEIAAEAVARIEPELWQVEALRSAAHPPENPLAYDLLLLSIPPMAQMDRDGFMQAGECLARAIQLAPEFPAVHCWYAFWHVLLISQGWAPDLGRAVARGAELAERAVALNPLAGRTLTIAGLLQAQQAADEAAAFYDRALKVNPYLAMTWALSAVNCLNLGDLTEAERRFDTYKALSPRDRFAFVFDAFFAPFHLIRRDYEAALVAGYLVMQLNPRFSAGYKTSLPALGHLRMHEEAASVLRRLRAIEPDFSIAHCLATTWLRRPADREHLAEGLHLAGVP